ncbi:hypothetical protein QBC40DRAFT_324252 [Triangularia verruculosa]|uniref:Uncharacterized protein n=1 Tax=Triangularia verruculosa TaxID=2587418 RepID=A0AAN6XIS5_9PEZI|nr:hypothetical protein QBC40DRAFT_324252 [Triangularia verruculosa]
MAPAPETSTSGSYDPLKTALDKIRLLEAEARDDKTIIQALKDQDLRDRQYIDCLEKRLTELRSEMAEMISSPRRNISVRPPSTRSSISIEPDDGNILVLSKSAVQVISKALGFDDASKGNFTCGDDTLHSHDGQNQAAWSSEAGLPTPSSASGLRILTPSPTASVPTPRAPSPNVLSKQTPLSEFCCECGDYIQHVWGQPSAYRLCAECEVGQSMAECDI